jgi:hypothetical protein
MRNNTHIVFLLLLFLFVIAIAIIYETRIYEGFTTPTANLYIPTPNSDIPSSQHPVESSETKSASPTSQIVKALAL